MIYKLYTLADITETGQYRSRSDLERLQQQNFDTVIQTIGLAGNIDTYKKPEITNGDIFGNKDLRCWYFEWTMEREQVIVNLTESVSFEKPMFNLGRNIIFDFMP